MCILLYQKSFITKSDSAYCTNPPKVSNGRTAPKADTPAVTSSTGRWLDGLRGNVYTRSA
ncbi:MAG: hypothetical protein K2I06_13455 [Ruminococcus sp.]|nr:hypothetical protein [Ruminococcus sp.]